MKSKIINELISKVNLKTAVKSLKPNVSFNLPKGNRYYIAFRNWPGVTSGTMITLEYEGKKFPIGSRRYFATYEDAENVARLWWNLANNSTGGWGKKILDNLYVVDTLNATRTTVISKRWYGDVQYETWDYSTNAAVKINM